MAPSGGLLMAIAKAVSVQTLLLGLIALVAGIVLGRTVIGQMVYASAATNARRAMPASTPRRCGCWALVFSAMCASAAGIIYVAYLRSFNPSAGSLRELDGIASVIIGGGSIFGGFGTIIGSLAGAAAITLIRSLLSLQIIMPDGSSFVLPQHWMNVFIGLILIGAVVGDIWIRQEDILSRIFKRRSATQEASLT